MEIAIEEILTRLFVIKFQPQFLFESTVLLFPIELGEPCVNVGNESTRPIPQRATATM